MRKEEVKLLCKKQDYVTNFFKDTIAFMLRIEDNNGRREFDDL